MKEELLHENNLAQTWLGNIKKAFQKEQKRLKYQGIEIRMKSVWQSLHDEIWAAKNRQKEIKKLPKSPPHIESV